MSTIRLTWWVSSIIQIIGVFSLSLGLFHPSICFIILLAGSMYGCAAAESEKNYALLSLNIAFTISNVMGIYHWSGVKL